MLRDPVPISLKPAEFELAVKGILDAAAGSLVNYESSHLETLVALDGEYTVDVSARFEALGAVFHVIVECKHLKRKVERQEVQILHAKLQSLGAQKGMLFSSSGFQSGAIDYADAHGIALVQLVSGDSNWFTKSEGFGSQSSVPSWEPVPKFIGWWCSGNSMALVSEEEPEYSRRALGLCDGD